MWMPQERSAFAPAAPSPLPPRKAPKTARAVPPGHVPAPRRRARHAAFVRLTRASPPAPGFPPPPGRKAPAPRAPEAPAAPR